MIFIYERNRLATLRTIGTAGSGTAVQCNFAAPRPLVWLRCGLVSLYSSRLYKISAFFNLDFDCPRDHQVSLVLFVAME